nr:replication initiation protein [Jiella mangrovi]
MAICQNPFVSDSLSLFSETELSGIQTTGSPWLLDVADPATVPVPLQVVITNIEGPFTARDRKLWTFLLHAAFDELGQRGGHSLKISDINAVFRSLGGEHSTEWIWNSAKRLSKTTVEFETTFGEEVYDTITSIFWATVPRKGRRGNELHFGFPEPLIPLIKEPLRFARLRVHFLIQLSGKYAVTLYEILEGFANRRDGQCRVTIADLRRWLKVPEEAYGNWKDLRKWVIDPAVNQINADPLGAGFTVEYEPIRKGRNYHELVFKLTKTDGRKMVESRLKRAAHKGERFNISAKAEETAREIAISKGWDYYALLERWRSHAHKQAEKGNPPKNADAAFIGYCKRQKELRAA